ncbi:TIGR00296 family protein [Methanococcus aeolicus]|uniref:TIGR00296 family protein n=1 Tax=Methanococcus aeolicus TaxID=42879 RepID=UPI0021C9F54C|nr:TIGR00296 family protein [Methanococcus aeolicus]UXM85231.1 TIGR00296 family protein [Methanococcus aeolicus]
MEKLSFEEGKFAVKFARTNIECYLSGVHYVVDDLPPIFKKPRGVFTTLYTYPKRNLRGCIGIPEPVMPLIDALKEASISASVDDPRFPPVGRMELRDITIEISILTPPKLVEANSPADYLEKIKVGRDGLIIEYGTYRGLLLPQVPIEHNWDIGEYLANLCLKAGLPVDTWIKKKVNIYSFESQIFKELSPNGKIVEEK